MLLQRLGVAFLLAPLLLGPELSGRILGVDSASLAQRVLVLAGLAAAAVLLRLVWPPVPAWVVLGLFAAGFLVTVVTVHAGVGLRGPQDFIWTWTHLDGWSVGDGRAVRGLGGYAIPWLFLFVRLPALTTLRALAWLPVAALVLATVLHVTGVVDAFPTDSDGVFQLQGILPPAYVGAVAAYGMAAGLWLWIGRFRDGLPLVIAGGAVLLMSGARGPMVFVAITALLVVFVPWRGVAVPRRVRVVTGVGALVAAVPAAAVVIHRMTQIEKYTDVLTGRGDAWRFYWHLSTWRPWQGWGIGANSELGGFSHIKQVQKFQAPHNVYLQLLVDFGWPLAVALLAALVWLYVAMIRRLRGLDRALGVGAGVATLVYAFFDNQLTAYQPACLSVVLFAALLRHSREQPGSVGAAGPEDGADGAQQDQQVLPG